MVAFEIMFQNTFIINVFEILLLFHLQRCKADQHKIQCKKLYFPRLESLKNNFCSTLWFIS